MAIKLTKMPIGEDDLIDFDGYLIKVKDFVKLVHSKSRDYEDSYSSAEGLDPRLVNLYKEKGVYFCPQNEGEKGIKCGFLQVDDTKPAKWKQGEFRIKLSLEFYEHEEEIEEDEILDSEPVSLLDDIRQSLIVAEIAES